MVEVVGLYATGSYLPVDEPGTMGDEPDTDPLTTQLRMEERTQGLLVTRGGGEWRKDQQNWIVPLCDRIYRELRLPFFTAPKRPTYLRYMAKMLLGLVMYPWAKASIDRISEFPHAEWSRADFQAYEKVQQRLNGKALYMVGVPSPRAIKMFAGMMVGGQVEFEAKLRPQVDRILEDNPLAVLQWELPAELAFASVPGPMGWKRPIIRHQLETVARMAAGLPPGTRHAFHLCWGDLNNRPFTPLFLQSDLTKVLFINAINELPIWQHNGGDQVLFAVHDPHCDGQHRPRPAEDVVRTYERYLVPLPDDTIYVVGVLHRDFSADETLEFVETFRRRLGGKVARMAIAGPCGDPRKGGEAEIDDQYAKARKVYEELRGS